MNVLNSDLFYENIGNKLHHPYGRMAFDMKKDKEKILE